MDAAKRYFRSPAAVIGLVLLLIVVAMAVSAGWFYPREPLSLAGQATCPESGARARRRPQLGRGGGRRASG